MHAATEGFRGGAPAIRVRAVNDCAVNPAGQYVLYWMIANRRTRFNFSLDRALAWARELGRPVVVLEALRIDYPYASERLHRFVIDGMAANGIAFERSGILYYPYVEPAPGAARGLLERLSDAACLVVTDDFPCFFLPEVVKSAGRRVTVRLEAIDSNGLMPMAAVPQAYPAAVHLRRFIQKTLRTQLLDLPSASPLGLELPSRLATLPADVLTRWPAAEPDLLSGAPGTLGRLGIDHRVGVLPLRGGEDAANRVLCSFVQRHLGAYHERHSHPDDRGTSRLSPYLHFGQISAHEVFNAVMKAEGWSLGRLSRTVTGARQGWWGVRPGAEAFLDQLVVWRELGFNTCFRRPDDYDRFEGLPGWAQETLLLHSRDPRPYTYELRTFERAETHDPLWNAAQHELVRDGWMHNYMRMLWGKKILEWSATPQEALETMIAIMNRWALDGRDPNSYAGYTWVLGRYDRPWPERPIYGTVRSMSSANTQRKIRVAAYLSPDQLHFSEN
ncbi:MAG: deoxyribodipyrimidine photolyase [Vicinamibacterales bacterium]